MYFSVLCVRVLLCLHRPLHGNSDSMYACVDLVSDRISRKLRRFKERKIASKKKRVALGESSEEVRIISYLSYRLLSASWLFCRTKSTRISCFVYIRACFSCELQYTAVVLWVVTNACVVE